MRTYKLFRIRDGDLYPLFVESNRRMDIGVWLQAHIGELADERHVKSRNGPLSLRPGFHSTEVPFTDWIGKKAPDGTLLQRKNTVWCECEVDGEQVTVIERYGLRTIPDGWYYFKTNARQERPWIISSRIRIRRILPHAEVEQVCKEHGIKAQEMERSGDG